MEKFLYASINIEKFLCKLRHWKVFVCKCVDMEEFFVYRHEEMCIVDIVYLVAWISRGFLSVVDYI